MHELVGEVLGCSNEWHEATIMLIKEDSTLPCWLVFVHFEYWVDFILYSLLNEHL